MNRHLQYNISNDIESQASLVDMMKEISMIDVHGHYPDAHQILQTLKC